MKADTEDSQPVHEKPATPTARVFYKFRDLFIKQGSVYMARSLKLIPMVIALLAAVVFFALAIYKFSHPIRTKPSAGSLVEIPINETKPEEPISKEAADKPAGQFPSNAEIARRLIDRDAPARREIAGRNSEARVELNSGGTDLSSWGIPPDTQIERARQDRQAATHEPSHGGTDSGWKSGAVENNASGTKAFELGSSDRDPVSAGSHGSIDQAAIKDYEYIDLIRRRGPEDDKPGATIGSEILSAKDRGIASDMFAARERNRKPKDAGRDETGNGKTIERDIRARLLTGIDTGLGLSRVIAEIARDTQVGAVMLRAGDLVVGSVTRAGRHRVSVQFTRWLDAKHDVHEIDAEATDLDGMPGLRGQSADSRLKRSVLYANERVLDYIRAIKGGIVFYNPAQSDISQLANRELIVEPNREFYVSLNGTKEPPRGAARSNL